MPGMISKQPNGLISTVVDASTEEELRALLIEHMS